MPERPALDCAESRHDRCESWLVVGACVRITNNDYFDYGGSAPFGGTIEHVYADTEEADVRFFDECEGGRWCWCTWTFSLADLEAMTP